MEDRLKKLRKSMEDTALGQLSFSAQHRKGVHEKIKGSEEKDHAYFSVLQLLSTKKTGFELTQLLRSRGVQRFENREGFLYIFLHSLEQKKIIQASWDNEDKYYQLSQKGRRIVQKAEETPLKRAAVLKGLIQE
ncbi:PadR family transcriptional regulator [Jeotgalibacillus proteolyticus]|uniref:PadR family transcriptional regulator n=1 Tax=Jeotgalibacillus proteolyticus TaxID=2082395 RepID=UPI003CE6AF88